MHQPSMLTTMGETRPQGHGQGCNYHLGEAMRQHQPTRGVTIEHNHTSTAKFKSLSIWMDAERRLGQSVETNHKVRAMRAATR